MRIKEKINSLTLNTKGAVIISLTVFFITIILTLLLQLALKQEEISILNSLRSHFPNYVSAREDILNAFSIDRLDRYLTLLPLFAFVNLFSIYFAVSYLLKKVYGNGEELIQNTAHEIKTPLFALKTSLDVLNLKKRKEKSDYENFIDTASIITARLNRLIESLLIVTKTSREFSKAEMCNLSDVLNDVISTYKAKSNKKKIKMKLFIKENIKFQIQQRYAEALFTNIIDNAVKYTPSKKEIIISLKRFEKDQRNHKVNDNNSIQFVCSDSGIGVPENEMKKIATKFYRASNTFEAGEDGSGLGLAAVKKILNEYNGSLEIKNNTKGGLDITVKLI